MYSPDALAAFIIYMGIAIALIGVISAVLINVKLYLSGPKKWLVVVKAPHSFQFVKAFRSEERASRYARRKNKWTFLTYRVIHYTTWWDYLQGEDGIA